MIRKNMRKSAAFLASLGLLCAILLACSGCGGDKETEALIGDWVATVDLTEVVNNELEAGMGGDTELMSYFNIDNFTIKVNLSFQEDGSYSFSADEAAMEQSLDTVIEGFRESFIRYFEDSIAAEDLDMTVDELLEATGIDLDELLAESFNKEDMMSSLDSMESSGTFKAKNGTLSLTDSDGTGLESYELDGNTLTLTGEGVEDSSVMGLYPMVFTKQ